MCVINLQNELLYISHHCPQENTELSSAGRKIFTSSQKHIRATDVMIFCVQAAGPTATSRKPQTLYNLHLTENSHTEIEWFLRPCCPWVVKTNQIWKKHRTMTFKYLFKHHGLGKNNHISYVNLV